MLILKMSVLENFLLEPMIFLYQNEAGVMRYSSTSDFGSSGTKRGTVAYRCEPIWVRYPLGGGYHSYCIPFESSLRAEYNTETRLKNG